MPGGALLSFVHRLCLGTLSFAELRRKDRIPDESRTKPCRLFFCKLLAYRLAEGASPTADGAGGGGVATMPTLITGSARPTPGSNTVVTFTKNSLSNPSLFSLGGKTTHGNKKQQKKRLRRYEDARWCAPVFCASSLSRDTVFCRRKDRIPAADESRTKPCRLFFCKLLAYRLALGASPTADGAGGRGVATVPTLITGFFSPPNPGSNTAVIFTKESLAKPSLFPFEKTMHGIEKKERNKTSPFEIPGDPVRQGARRGRARGYAFRYHIYVQARGLSVLCIDFAIVPQGRGVNIHTHNIYFVFSK